MIFSNRLVGAVLLIAGTSIGAGMLALPVVSAPSGFIYAMLLISVCWFFMYITGLYVLEVNLALPDEPSYISMANSTLGHLGGVVTWVLFLLLLYSLLAAYITGGGDMIAEIVQTVFVKTLPEKLGPIVWSVIFGIAIYFGVRSADLINRLFMLGLVASFALLMVIALPKVNAQVMEQGRVIYLIAALPVVFTGLGYHIIVPSCCRYLNKQALPIAKAIFWGSFIPLLAYLLWELVVFGLIPISGDSGLIAILKSGHTGVGLIHSMQQLIHNPWLTLGARFFLFFAIASSFIGVAFGLFDLLADGLAINKSYLGRLLLVLLTLLPPLLYAFYYPKGFILALSYAGVFVAIVHGLLPALMAWRLRKRVTTDYQVWGGSGLLLIVMLFFILVIYADIASNLHWIAKF